MSGNSKKQVSNLPNHLIRHSVHLAVLAALAAGGVVTQVQAQQAPAPADTSIQEVIVTGSMIKRANAETAEAVTVITADTFKDQGIVNVEQALNTLTANTPSVNISSAVGTFSGGGTYVDLRGLGNGRTLVLLDGQRLAPNAFTGNAVDLSGIPFSSIDKVEVLREGASALYGSDAIAGVVNFITKKNFQGATIQGNFDHPQGPGGASGEMDLTLGHGDLAADGYHIMLTASYTKQQELRATQRGFSAAGYDPARGVTNTNDPGTWPGSIEDANQNFYQSGFPACAGNPLLTTDNGDCAYRYSAATDLLPQSSAGSGMLSITKALPANNTLQLQYLYSRSTVTGYSGPMFYFYELNPTSPYFPSASQLTCVGGAANCGNAPPDLTDPVDAVWSDPANNRFNGNINTEQRILLTFSGTNGGWDYTADLNYSQNKNDNRNTGGYPDESVQAPTVDPVTGVAILSNLINPFGPQSAAGQALINQSYVNGVYQVGDDKRWSVDVHASHPLGDAFDAGTPATFALGIDVGGERFTNATTPYNDVTSAATGLTDAVVAGSRQSQAVYAELDVPMSKSLDLDISDREDRYSDFGRTNNGKVSLRYQPLTFLTLRGTASTGFRAPTLYDLYTPNFLAASSAGTIGQGNPDCGATPVAPFTTPTCNSQGLGLYGGNRTLTPETSQNFDFGVVVSPIQDLGITIDYYRILLKNTIATIPTSAIYSDPTTFASQYVFGSNGLTPTIQESSACHPSYTLPTCGYILKNFQNTGRITTDGIDLSVQYLQRTAFGNFHEDLEGTATTQFLDEQYTGGPPRNLVGWFNHLAPAYRWQHNLRLDWTSPNGMLGAGLGHRFYSRYIDEFKVNGQTRTVGDYSTIDTYVSYKPLEKMTVLFGIKNLLNKNPPFTNASQDNFAAGYNQLVVDPLLRNFYVNVKYSIF